MMRDRSGREITYLRISITDLCNFRCRYCMPADGIDDKREHADIMTFEEISSIAEAAVSLGVRKIRVSGGEPLVRRGACGFIRALSSLGVELAMTTNGSLLERYAEELASSGLSRINISLDTLDEEKFRSLTRGGELADVLRGIDAASRAGLEPIKINTVLIGGSNDDEIESLAAMTMDRPIDVRFIELMPIGPGASYGPGAYVPASVVLDRIGEAEPLGRDGVARMYRMRGAAGRVGLISPVSSHFCSECSRLRLTADGYIKPCLHSRDEIYVRGLAGSELIDAIKGAVAAKPKDHGGLAGGGSQSARLMDRIGG